jgi:hypothetical protein
MLNGAGGVRIDRGSTSFRLRGAQHARPAATRRPGASAAHHLNLGYLFDNSGNLVSDVESARKSQRDQRG